MIVAGETGSGKTTQLPKLCLEVAQERGGPVRTIGCTQPRRVAALSVSKRVAEELDVPWGREVGCKIRFGDSTSRETRIKFMTDGILLAEIQSDPLLRSYGTLIIDEAHERSLNIDFLLGYLQLLLKRRPDDLQVVITSATIDTAEFSKAFGGAPVVEVSGRMYPVEVRYHTPDPDDDEEDDPSHVLTAVRATEDVLIESDDGDVLVFMPTERDIRETKDLLEQRLGKGIEVLGLFGRMPAGEQTRIFSPGGPRRVIVATNIAETSITIPRIRYVIDAGLSRMARYNPRTRTKRLPVEAISQSSANQRAGRAGRLRDGICVRLYEEEDFEKRGKFTQPEIQRANLAEVILRMKAFRLGEIETFPFLSPPLPAAIRAGYELLHELGALDDAHEMTELGRELARLPLDPTLGRMLLQARTEGALAEVLVIAAGLSVPDPREWPEDAKEAAAAAHKQFAVADSDFLTLLKMWRAMPEGASGGALRKFAKGNFLSQSRLREWRDVHRQLTEVMGDGEEGSRQQVEGRRQTGDRGGSRSDNATGGRQRGQPEEPRAKSATEEGAAGGNRNQAESWSQPLGRTPGESTTRRGAVDSHGRLGPSSQPLQNEPLRGRMAGSDEAVHRSVLTGLLGQIAMKKERNSYLASGNRQVTIFPGSALYARQERRKKGEAVAADGAAVADKGNQPPWIVAGEIVQTSQLFARTVGRINPEWVAELGAHLCRFSYADPQWNVKAGRVLAWERVLLHGLEVLRRKVDYGKIDPEKATEIFIRGALVEREEAEEVPRSKNQDSRKVQDSRPKEESGDRAVSVESLRFFQHNRRLRERIEAALTRVRDRRVDSLDEAFYRFYAARISGVSSVHDLNKLVRERSGREPEFLFANEETLLPNGEDGGFAFDRHLFPEQVSLGNTALPLSYAYAPGEERDGVTVRVPLPVAENLTTGQLQWMVPGLREEQAGILLRALPKGTRKALMPMEGKARIVAAEFEPGRADFLGALAVFLTRRFGVEVRAEDWPAGSLPAHLTPRVEVVDRNNKAVVTGRDLGVIQATLEKADVRTDAWAVSAKRWERPAVRTWSFGDLPESVVVETIGGAPSLAFPGLSVNGAETDVRLFRRREEAETASRAGVRRLAERVLERDLAWVRKELGTLLARGAQPGMRKPEKDLRSALDGWGGGTALAKPATKAGVVTGGAVVGRTPGEALAEATYQHVVGVALTLEPVLPLREARFLAMVNAAKRDLPMLARRTGEAVAKVLEQKRAILAAGKKYAGMEADLARLAGEDFPARTPAERLAQLPRYLRAVAVRAERAVVSPAKDAEKARLVGEFAGWEARVTAEAREAFRWLLEEYRVSVFAQELGTAQPVSAQRLRALGGW